MSDSVICDHAGCKETENLVETVYPDGEVEGIYCSEHVPDCFCWGCGSFCAGMESFDFAESLGGIKGLCEGCCEQVRADCGEDRYGNPIDDYDDEWGWEEDY